MEKNDGNKELQILDPDSNKELQILGPDANETNEADIDYEDNEDIDLQFSITSVFYIHLPQYLDPGNYQPVILGSCATLGKWKVPKVLLHQINNSTLWVSDPVRIPTHVEDIFYKYAICRREKNWFRKDKLVVDYFEGFGGERTNRKMEFLENHYDLWQDNYNMKLNMRFLKNDFQFVK
ncbi:21270_t:CDS:1, partial [Racocetra persica]